MARMCICTSVVPPPIVSAGAKEKARDQPESSTSSQSIPSRSTASSFTCCYVRSAASLVTDAALPLVDSIR